jgi:catechol 2,3-dioxygenase-like lactoylglutathione lyase family enzyme
MKLRPMLQVADVEASSRWYQQVLGLTSGHGGDGFEMLMHGDDHLLDLHRLDAHEHGFATPESGSARGAGVSLWFETSDRQAFESLFAHVAESGATVLEPAHWNPLAHHHEATLMDLDGYVVAIHSPFDFADTGQRP